MTAFGLLFGPDGWGGLLLQGGRRHHPAGARHHAGRIRRGARCWRWLKTSSNRRRSRAICEAYTTFFRGIPDLLALFIIYFGLQALLDKLGRRSRSTSISSSTPSSPG